MGTLPLDRYLPPGARLGGSGCVTAITALPLRCLEHHRTCRYLPAVPLSPGLQDCLLFYRSGCSGEPLRWTFPVSAGVPCPFYRFRYRVLFYLRLRSCDTWEPLPCPTTGTTWDSASGYGRVHLLVTCRIPGFLEPLSAFVTISATTCLEHDGVALGPPPAAFCRSFPLPLPFCGIYRYHLPFYRSAFSTCVAHTDLILQFIRRVHFVYYLPLPGTVHLYRSGRVGHYRTVTVYRLRSGFTTALGLPCVPQTCRCHSAVTWEVLPACCAAAPCHRSAYLPFTVSAGRWFLLPAGGLHHHLVWGYRTLLNHLHCTTRVQMPAPPACCVFLFSGLPGSLGEHTFLNF